MKIYDYFIVTTFNYNRNKNNLSCVNRSVFISKI